jgi:WD40 repeat protein
MREIIAVDNIRKINQLTQVKCGWITQVVWSPDSTTLAVASANGVRIYAGQFGGQPTHNLTGHEGHVKGTAFSPDGKLLASVASDTTLKLWDTSDIQNAVPEVATLKAHTDSIDAVAFSPDGKSIATASADGSIYLWDVASGKQRAKLDGHEKEVATLTFAMEGNVLFSGSWDNSIRMWDSGAQTGGTVFGQHEDWVRFLSVNPTGTMLASASKDGTVRLWDVYETDESYALIQAHTGGADAVAFSPDGTLIATGGRDHVVRVWSVYQLLADRTAGIQDALLTIPGHEKPVMSVAFNSAGTLLASGSGDNTVRLWAIHPNDG